MTHDASCELASENKSSAMRLAADRELRRCIASKGHPVMANIAWVGVRIWVNLKGGY